MPNEPKSKQYDLEERTYKFAKDVRNVVRESVKTVVSLDDMKQLIRSSGSVGANYIEANESLSKKDFLHRIKICRKEAKESVYWLKLLNSEVSKEVGDKLSRLEREATELMKIFGAIVTKSE